MDFCPVNKSERMDATNTPTTRGGTGGRWTQEEHALFVRGLIQFGKDWCTIAKFIQTRTVVQVRTHAQKYFIKMKKYKENMQFEEGDDAVSPAPCLPAAEPIMLSSALTSLNTTNQSTQQILYDFLTVPLDKSSVKDSVPVWFREGHPLSLLLRNVSDMDFTAEDVPTPTVGDMDVENGISFSEEDTELAHKRAAVFGPSASAGVIDETLVKNIWEILSGAEIDPVVDMVADDDDSSTNVVLEVVEPKLH